MARVTRRTTIFEGSVVEVAELLRLTRKSRPYPPAPAALMSHSPTTDRRSPTENTSPLTPREREIVALLVQGLTVKQAAAHMIIEYDSAKTTKANVYRKLGVHSRVALVEWWRQHGD